MTEDRDGRPLVVSTARGLGVRLGEIPADDDGVVEPEAGGMSVAVGDPGFLPEHRRPQEIGGTGPDPVWEIEESEIGELLECRRDPKKPTEHGFLEPVRPMQLEEYELALAETRDVWRICR
jgi:hypothetical protein